MFDGIAASVAGYGKVVYLFAVDAVNDGVLYDTHLLLTHRAVGAPEVEHDDTAAQIR